MKGDRKCVVCRAIKNQNELLRVTKIENQYFIDDKHKLEGRGAYICKDSQCLQTAIKKRLLNKSFRCNLPNEIYQILEEYGKNN